MKNESRRGFLTTSGKLLVGVTALGSLSVFAAEEHGKLNSGQGLVIDASSDNTCATCQYWGGMRKVSDDKKQIIAQSMGWCNNPDSLNHQKLTVADHHMKKPGIWEKWSAL